MNNVTEPIAVNITSILPMLVVFDLDYTLWPFFVDSDIEWPCTRRDKNEIVNKYGAKIRYYLEVPAILEKLNNESIEIAVASVSEESEGANQLLNLFGWDKYITFKEIFYAENKTTHLIKIQEKSKVPFDKMIFFDDEYLNLQNAKKLGIFCVQIQYGIRMDTVEKALKEYRTKMVPKKLRA